MPDPAPPRGSQASIDASSESERQRTERQLMELLQELRVALPGVQVLFAFLLVVPFQQRFGEVGDFEKAVYYATLVAAALTSGFFIAPAAYHRLRFHRHDRRHIIEVSNRFTIAGLASLAVAMSGAVVLVTDFLFDDHVAGIAAGAIAAAFFALVWFVGPLRNRAPRS